MRKVFGGVLSIIVFLNGGVGSTVFGAEGGGASTPVVEYENSVQKIAPMKDTQGEIVWRERLDNVKGQRNALWFFGVGTTVAGVVVMASGIKDVNDAEEIPGCYKSGTTIICNNSESTSQAQDKLDKGETKTAIGGVATLAGAGLIVWGVFRGAKARRLTREGVNKGYSVDVRPNRDGMALVLNRSF
ncbi:MAG: hypothetical protein JNK54_07875 [Elusimicrobia bacterium]|nr:hypothetical protein [Elusimicrobiota bacterium]